jgi:ACR3 family arsenite transporter
MPKVLPSDDVVQSTPSGSNPPPSTFPFNSDVEKQALENGDGTIVNAPKTSAFKSLGWLDRFLALWIFLAMAIGIILGNFVPNTGPALQKGKFVGVSIPIAVGLLVMMYPILCKVKFETLHRVFRNRDIWIQILFSVVVNWIVAPLVMVCVLLI